MRNDRNAVQPFGNNFGLRESLVGITNRLCSRFLIIRRRFAAGFGMNGCGTDCLQNGVGCAIRLEHLQFVFARLLNETIPLDSADHLVSGHLVIEHVIDCIDAERSFFLCAALGRLSVADQVRELLEFHLDGADGVFRGGLVDGRYRDNIVARPMNGCAWPLHDVNRLNAGHLLSRAGIDAYNLGMRVGTAQHLAIKHARAMDIIGVLCLS